MYQLNRYSIALICVYLLAFLSMEHGYSANWGEELATTLPLIIAIVVWSELSTTRLSYKKLVSTQDSFHRDFFIINYATLFAFIVSLIGEYNNTDAKAWWTLLIAITELYGLVFGFIFALLALMLNRQHFRYTLIYAGVLLITFSTLKFMPPYIHAIILGDISIFLACAFIFLSAHTLICIGYRFSKYIPLTK